MFDQMADIADQLLLRWEREGPAHRTDVADNVTRLNSEGTRTFFPTDQPVTAGEILSSYAELSLPATRKR